MDKKALLVAAAVLAAGPACAEWLEVNDSPQMTWFMDYSTLRVNGTSRRIWLLKEFRSPKSAAGTPYRSTKNFEEFDCSEDKNRTLQLIAYSGSKGTGTVIFTSDRPWEWAYNAPDTNGKAVADIICGLPAKSF